MDRRKRLAGSCCLSRMSTCTSSRQGRPKAGCRALLGIELSHSAVSWVKVLKLSGSIPPSVKSWLGPFSRRFLQYQCYDSLESLKDSAHSTASLLQWCKTTIPAVEWYILCVCCVLSLCWYHKGRHYGIITAGCFCSSKCAFLNNISTAAQMVSYTVLIG